jgi:HAD superfamily hydrolase (TIGR01549 family)
MLRAVTFDYWNTLFEDHGGAERERRRAQRLREELGAQGCDPPGGAIEEALSAGYQFFEEVWHREARTPGTAEILTVIVATLQVRLPAEVMARLTSDFARMLLEVPPVPLPDAPGVVRKLAGRYRLGVICDTGYSPGEVLRELLDRHGILDAFDYLYFSNEGGMSKPDPRVFRRALDALEVRAQEAAHVGDMQRTDIAGAQAAGMLAVHFLGASDRDAGISTADAQVTRFADLPAALGALVCPGC